MVELKAPYASIFILLLEVPLIVVGPLAFVFAVAICAAWFSDDWTSSL
jgi:hypothetical protein